MPNFSSPRSRAASRGYSLIELLAVMAILSAFAGFTLGSLSPVKANALTSGGNQIADLLASARQNSISRHAFTAVVIKSADIARYSAYCLFERTRNDDGNFADWRMLSPWRSLPEGVRFDPDAAAVAPAANFLARSPLPPAFPTSVKFRGEAVSMTSGAVLQVFGPDGTLTKGEPVRLRLVEGAEGAGDGIIYTGRKSGDRPVNYYDIVVVRETGRTKVERL